MISNGKPPREEQQSADWRNRAEFATACQSHHVQAARKQNNAAEEEPGREAAAACGRRWSQSTEPDRERVHEVILRGGLPPSEALLAIRLLLSPAFEAVCTEGAERDAEKAEDSCEHEGEAFHAPSMA